MKGSQAELHLQQCATVAAERQHGYWNGSSWQDLSAVKYEQRAAD